VIDVRYFSNGGRRVVRVHTDGPLGLEFLKARAEVFNFGVGEWRERPNLTDEVVFTGELEPCSQADANVLIERGRSVSSR